LPVGSSASSISGCVMSARAIAARCFSPPDSTGGKASQPVAEPDPAQQLHDVGGGSRSRRLSEHAQRQRDVLEGGQVVEQAEVLEHHADAPAQRRQFRLGQRGGRVAAEDA
jgi:hypothetical protein